jgi:tetratricopeptide (TPR) repeat protein
MEELLATIHDLKTKAKNRRDLERYESAVSFLQKALQILEPALASATRTEWKSQLASELADCYGLLGGVYRRWALSSTDVKDQQERMQASFEAYNKGYQEYEAHEEYKISNSYNQLNRLVSYVLCTPNCFAGGASPNGETLPLKEELEKAGESIRQQLMLERRGDVWALADLALVNLLLDRETPVSAYASFIAASPPDHAYDSALSVLRPLASRGLPMSAKLKDAVGLLESRLQQLRVG